MVRSIKFRCCSDTQGLTFHGLAGGQHTEECTGSGTGRHRQPVAGFCADA